MGFCTGVSKFFHYIFDTFLFLVGAAVMAIGIYLVASNYEGFIEKWFLWVSIFAGALLMIFAIIGCVAASSQTKWVLWLYWIIPALVLVLFLVTAIGISVYFSYTDSLADKTAGQLNALDTGSTLYDVYDDMREGYGTLWEKQNCDVNCTINNLAAIECTEVICDDGTVEDWMNDWIEDASPGISASSFEVCRELSINAKGIEGSESATSGWCASNIAVVSDINDWMLGFMIGLWIVVGFILLALVANCMLIIFRKKDKSRAADVAPVTATNTQAAPSVGTPQEV
ncbi:hypothetical protein FOL47_001861 [Perkinsus chesapeaki]|uniref:Uncharacterized protein n=1 Tax=Perkinsus chesapeaki TaxID=330153 RepID=A0A7J6MGE4_PERCH|nr:hypothetical protein FOL47_001861 [Perkinsus chesapeaki]